MSKKIKPPSSGLFVAVVVILAAVLAGGAARGGAAQQASATANAVNAKSAAVVAATAEVLRETSEVRNLPILRSVRSGAQSRAEIERMIIQNLDESSTPDEMRASERELKKLGLVPPDFQL
ncbi:MAG TPA: hypothetical protein VM943_04715, partial [Pyrinomonadaceae bacterium]|nr:hypothetical protein [Pyrinomonadaceae bacterium]